MRDSLRLALLLFGAAATGCASAPPKLPYPAFVQADELPDVFMASLPGVRAKQFAGNAQSGTTSNRVDLPSGWKGTSGAAPGKALELFVLDGELRLADMTLRRGGYAYLPSGTLGFNLRTDAGARVLYFLDELDRRAVIETPLIADAALISWRPAPTAGVSIKELRADPGSGARTWLLRIEPGATLGWESSSALREGYLVSGEYRHSECVEGETHTAQYAGGGYFVRPAGTPNGGPEAAALSESIWFLREKSAGDVRRHEACTAATPEPGL